MRKSVIVMAFVLVIISVIAIAGCKQTPLEGNQGPLFNDSLNQQIESLTNTSNITEIFEEFLFNYTLRDKAKYEIAKDDVFSLSNTDFNSSEVSFLGVMLGDSYDDVILLLGKPDAEFIYDNGTYRNLDYNKVIGVNGTAPAITLHFDNNTLTRITIKPLFNKYLHGNTSLGQQKEIIYALFDIPDYQSFISGFKVFHYVEKGVEFYFDSKNVDRISFITPADFKGVEYVTKQISTKDGIVANVTEPVEIK